MRGISVLLVMSLFAGCGSDNAEESMPASMQPEDTVFGDMTQTMERAKSVESMTLERKQELDRALEADDGGS